MSNNGVAARHSSEHVEHYTPPVIVEAARHVLGGIDLDPASCDLANMTVQARRIFTVAQDGFTRPWEGRVFLNPPGGKVDGQSSQKAWWFKLAREWIEGRVTAAVFIGFSVEILQTTQVKSPEGLPVPAELPHCSPSRRIAYWNDRTGKLERGSSPPHSSVIVYLPPRVDRILWDHGVRVFDFTFRQIGKCCGPLFDRGWAL